MSNAGLTEVWFKRGSAERTVQKSTIYQPAAGEDEAHRVILTRASPDAKDEVFHLQMSPSRSQFFLYERFSLSCDALSRGGLLKRNTTRKGVETCPNGWGALKGSTCTIQTMYLFDGGLYWCETESGEQSHALTISVTDGAVILESPALPVKEGDSVTLCCTNRETSSIVQNDFYKDGRLINSSMTGNMTIHSVSRSDEGLYKCISGAGVSADSWLSVRVPDPAGPDAPPVPVFTILRVICHVVAGTPYLLSTIILALIYRDRRRENQSNRVIMEME
ncbi:low affinity immunoglobulin gamma Fc region receptor II-a-like [Cheilinus undulatus]|uniref:low affinity immunoglobulin gamma Fc region receptor II-a-like n=1 Tax=Cheilinus undulatus TaxID=241271 RepID=UPI001BD579E5|nr:low affinity immunoglobulin gamma Fc region receptor II-a-like [Cheilinus undulatus]